MTSGKGMSLAVVGGGQVDEQENYYRLALRLQLLHCVVEVSCRKVHRRSADI